MKLEKAIKAAEAAGLTMTKIPTYEYKEVEIKEEMPTIHDRNLLAELNSESFVQKSFVSSRNKKQNQNIVIDLNAQTVTVPEADIKVQKDDSIIDFNVSIHVQYNTVILAFLLLKLTSNNLFAHSFKSLSGTINCLPCIPVI